MKGNSRASLFTLSGGLMTLSALLMLLCGRIAVGACFLASAACMFVTGYNFWLAEKKNEEDSKYE